MQANQSSSGITVQMIVGKFYCEHRNAKLLAESWKAAMNAHAYDDVIIIDYDTEQVIPLTEDLSPENTYLIGNSYNGRLREEFVQELYHIYHEHISSRNAEDVLYYYRHTDIPLEFFTDIYPKYKELFGPIITGKNKYSIDILKQSTFRLEKCIIKSFGNFKTHNY